MACAGLLVGLSLILRGLRDLHSALIRVERYQYEIGTASPPGPPSPLPSAPDSTDRGDETVVELPSPAPESVENHPPPWGEIVRLLEDIRDNSLLTESERQEKRHQTAERELLQTQKSIAAHIEGGDYARPAIADSLRAKFPNDPQAERVFEQLESSREQHETEDVGSVTKQVEDLINISAWQRARQLAQQLQQRHPDSVDARNLMLRIEREHRIFQEEQRRRMSAEVQRFVSRRRWEEALAAARTFVERFPGCPEADALLLQSTLNNAEIDFASNSKRKSWTSPPRSIYRAVRLARRVIEKYQLASGRPPASTLKRLQVATSTAP